MKDFQEYLEEGEQTEWNGEPHRGAVYTVFGFWLAALLVFGWFIFLADGIVETPSGILIPIAVYAVFFLALAVLFFQTLKQSYAITNRRVMIKKLFGTSFQSFPFEKIEGRKISKGLTGLIFGCGTLKLDIGDREEVPTSHSRHGIGGLLIGGTVNTRTRIKWYCLRYINNPGQVLGIITSKTQNEPGAETHRE